MADVTNLHEGDLTGTLIKLSTGEKIEVERMQINKQSEKRLLTVLNAGRITGSDVQDLYIRELWIKKECVDIFSKGQTPWIQEGNKIRPDKLPI